MRLSNKLTACLYSSWESCSPPNPSSGAITSGSSSSSSLNLLQLTKIKGSSTSNFSRRRVRRAGTTGVESVQDPNLAGTFDLLYVGEVALGTPPQNFSLQFDTGSSDLWVWQKGVQTSHKTFDPNASSTYRNDTAQWAISYGDGTGVTGFSGRETVSVGNLTLIGQTFALANSTDAGLEATPQDGLLGLGFTLNAADKGITFVENLLATRQLSNPYWGFFVERLEVLDASTDQNVSAPVPNELGEICFGCTDPSRFTGNIEFYDVVSPIQWAIESAGMTNGGNIVPGTNVRALIDSGTSLITFPTTMISKIASALGGSTMTDNTNTTFVTMKCKDFNKANFGFTFGNTNYPISAADLWYSTNGDQCVLGLYGMDIPDIDGTPLAIFGDVFMKNVYTVFSYPNATTSFSPTNASTFHQIGFAPSVQANSGFLNNSTGSGNGGGNGNGNGNGGKGPNSKSGAMRGINADFGLKGGLMATVLLIGGLTTLL